MTLYEIDNEIRKMTREERKALVETEAQKLRKKGYHVQAVQAMTLTIIVPSKELEKASRDMENELITVGSYC